MRIISLNTWGGRAGEDTLLNFFREQKDATDVFCLQEVWAGAYDEFDGASAGGRTLTISNISTQMKQRIAEILSEHTCYFRPHFLDHYGLAMFVRTSYTVLAEGEHFVHREKGYTPTGDIGKHARNIQYVTLNTSRGPVTVINFHGLWNGGGKEDCAERITQSKRALAFLESLNTEIIFCGDFNLLPNTESLNMFESAGLRNLVAEYNIQSTRTSFYTKPEKFADYIFVSQGVDVTDFAVLPDEISDHAPLALSVDEMRPA